MKNVDYLKQKKYYIKDIIEEINKNLWYNILNS